MTASSVSQWLGSPCPSSFVTAAVVMSQPGLLCIQSYLSGHLQHPCPGLPTVCVSFTSTVLSNDFSGPLCRDSDHMLLIPVAFWNVGLNFPDSLYIVCIQNHNHVDSTKFCSSLRYSLPGLGTAIGLSGCANSSLTSCFPAELSEASSFH